MIVHIYIYISDLLIHIDLDKLISKLDCRADKADKVSPSTKFLKERVDSSPSASLPPNEAPAWAVKQSHQYNPVGEH